MKPLTFTSLIIAFIVHTACAQMGDKAKRASPPATVNTTIGDATIKINYSRPSVNDRTIFGDLVPYGKVWRTGANEATTFTTNKDIFINGQRLASGTYALFSIPEENQWTLIFNKDAEQWGAYKYNDNNDVLRIHVPSEKHNHTEIMTISTEENKVYLDWEKTRVGFSITH